MALKFVKVRKDNKNRDRGFIAVDAICSVFENKENHNVSIMTMDGFWYDVDDDIDALYELITGDDKRKSEDRELAGNGKKDYYRRKRMMQPSIANEKMPINHEEIYRPVEDGQQTKEVGDEDFFRPIMRKGKQIKPHMSIRHIEKNLSAGADGQYDLNPTVERPPLGEGL